MIGLDFSMASSDVIKDVDQVLVKLSDACYQAALEEGPTTIGNRLLMKAAALKLCSLGPVQRKQNPMDMSSEEDWGGDRHAT